MIFCGGLHGEVVSAIKAFMKEAHAYKDEEFLKGIFAKLSADGSFDGWSHDVMNRFSRREHRSPAYHDDIVRSVQFATTYTTCYNLLWTWQTRKLRSKLLLHLQQETWIGYAINDENKVLQSTPLDNLMSAIGVMAKKKTYSPSLHMYNLPACLERLEKRTERVHAL
ncbi:hypothetical protein HDV05_002018 [Chytridiales sp. JEL 0842]|nr:hypothetical protein HDV05_002018 [Chytridiales sp. JEL 0842]